MPDNSKAWTVLLAWGDKEEGEYHWAGRATTQSRAEQKAREEMDRSYNEQYCKAGDDHARGKDVGKPTTEYEVIEAIEGVNEYAAPDMLTALLMVRTKYIRKMDPEDQKMVRDAIARGEARK